MVFYGKRLRAGLPIGSASAAAVVNELVSLRMAKQQQMRWSDDGAHALVLVGAAVLNGHLRERVVTILRYRKLANAKASSKTPNS